MTARPVSWRKDVCAPAMSFRGARGPRFMSPLVAAAGLRQEAEVFPGKSHIFVFCWYWARSLKAVSRLVILKHSKQKLEPKAI